MGESVVFLVLAVVCGAVTSYDLYDTARLIESQGYHTETHFVTTSDGYVLQVNRIPFRRHQKTADDPDRPVVFCMHGLLAASDSYVFVGPQNAPALNLADAGFDVWLGNARGTRNSRSHVSLNPDHFRQKQQFFDFSWEEIGMIDVPTMIDYALKVTGKKKLHYIGHSQGGTAFLVMSSMRPEYNDKLESVHLLAGVGYKNHFPHSQLSGLALMSDVLYNLGVSIGFVELFGPSSTRSAGSAASCISDPRYNYMCELVGANELLDIVGDIDSNLFDGYTPAGASLKQIAHYGQNIRDKAFRRWNYGLLQNLVKYRSATPPAYDLAKITSDVTMHYTISDELLDERDVLAMANVIPNGKVRKVARDDFSHVDFIAANDAKELVTDYIIEQIKSAK